MLWPLKTQALKARAVEKRILKQSEVGVFVNELTWFICSICTVQALIYMFTEVTDGALLRCATHRRACSGPTADSLAFPTKTKTFRVIKYLNIHPTNKWAVQKRYRFMCRFTDSLICDAMKTHWGTMENRHFLQSFYSTSIGFHRIAEGRVGGESTHKSISSLYSWFIGRMDI